jgi:hypothetical protein
MLPLVVILQTYQRTEYALRTVRSFVEKANYPQVVWFIADDGSQKEHVDQIASLLHTLGQTIVGMQNKKQGYGGNSNDAWFHADTISPLSFWLEDDWELTRPVNLIPYVETCLEPDVGMVRLGYLYTGLRGDLIARQNTLYWDLHAVPAHDGVPVFTGHPSIRHTRYRETFGWYPLGLNPGDTEMEYAFAFRQHGGPGKPKILFPVENGVWGPFAHIGTEKSYV